MLQVLILLACSALTEIVCKIYSKLTAAPLIQTIGSQLRWVNRFAIINEKI